MSPCPEFKCGWLYTKAMKRKKVWLFKKPVTNNLIRNYIDQLEIFSDASLTEWGACCVDRRTHGWWNSEVRSRHINYLELQAAVYALRFFAIDYRSGEILMGIDNITVISYVNRMGGIQYPKLNQIARLI